MAGTTTETEEVTKEVVVKDATPTASTEEATTEDTEKEVKETEVKKVDEEKTNEPTTNWEELVEKAAEVTLGKILPVFEQFKTSLTSMDERISDITSKAVTEEGKEEAAEEVVEKSALEIMEDKLAAMTQEMKDVKKSVGDAVPKRAPRKEMTEDIVKTTTTVTKSDDPNSVFDSMFGIASKVN